MRHRLEFLEVEGPFWLGEKVCMYFVSKGTWKEGILRDRRGVVMKMTLEVG